MAKKKLFLLLIAGIILLTIGCSKAKDEKVSAAAADNEKKEVLTLKFCSAWPPNYAMIEADKYWIKQVEKLVGDQVKIQFYTAGELVKQKEIFDAVADNVIQIGGDFPAYWAGKDTAFNLLGSWPMWFDVYDYINWIEYGGGQAEYDRVYGQFGIVPIMYAPSSQESGPMGKKPIKSLKDFKGLKIRMSGKNQGRIVQELGASPVTISSSEVYQGMQKGLLDAAESSSPYINWGIGYGEFTEYLSFPGWHQPGSMGMLLFNKKEWDKYPQNIKDAFTIAAKATALNTLAYRDYTSAEGVMKFRNSKIFKAEYKLSDDDLKTINKLALDEVYKEAKENPSFAKTALSMAEYLNYYQPWRELGAPFTHGWKDMMLPDVEKIKPFVK